MSESSQRLTPEPPKTEAEFPNGSAADGKVYQMANPANPLQQLVIMSMETYIKQGTLIQSLRQVAQAQDKRIKDVLAENKVLTEMIASTRTRLENLRAVRRAEKRPEVEAQLKAAGVEFISPPNGE